MLSTKIETPANHMTEDSHWDYRVTIKFKNSTVATTDNPDPKRDQAIVAGRYPGTALEMSSGSCERRKKQT